MRCPACKSGSGALIDMAPANASGKLACPDCGATVQLNDLGFQPAYFSPIPGPALTPTNTTVCRWCGVPFVAARGAHYCSEPCRFQARQAARKAYDRSRPYTPDTQERETKVSLAWAFADPSDQGWHL